MGRLSSCTLSDDLAAVIEQTGAHDATLVGFSMGGGEVARYMSRHDGRAVAKAALVARGGTRRAHYTAWRRTAARATTTRPLTGAACHDALTHPSPSISRRAARAARHVAALGLGLVILFEEWGWEPLARLLANIARLPLLAWLAQRIAALPPYAALVAFTLPWLILLPVKVLALWLIAAGHGALGVAVIVLAKVVGTATLAWLFTLTKPALMRLAWFAAVYERWVAWKAGLLASLRASRAWAWGRALKRGLARRLRRWRAMRP